MQPDLRPRRHHVTRRSDHPKLRSVGHFHHIVPTGTKEDLPCHSRGNDVILGGRFRSRQRDLMLADRDRGVGACLHRLAGDAERRAGERHRAAIERLALEHVAHADETRHELRARPVVDFHRRARLLDLAGIHHADHVRSRHRLGLVVRHIDRRVAILVVQSANLEAHLLAQVGVEVRQRLIEQQSLRLHDQRASKRHALLLAAGEFAWIAGRERCEPRGRENGVELLLDRVVVHLPQLQPVADVARDRHMRPQRVALEDHRHVAPLGRYGLLRRGHDAVTDRDLAHRRLHEACNQAERRGLAATRRTQKADQATVLDLQRHIIDDRKRTVLLRQIPQLDRRHFPPLRAFTSRTSLQRQTPARTENSGSRTQVPVNTGLRFSMNALRPS